MPQPGPFLYVSPKVLRTFGEGLSGFGQRLCLLGVTDLADQDGGG